MCIVSGRRTERVIDVSNSGVHPNNPHCARRRHLWRLAVLAALIAAELALLSESPPHDFIYSCWAAAPASLCQFFSLSIERAIFFLGTLLIFALADRRILQLLLSSRATNWKRLPWLALQFGGFGLILLPWTFAGVGASREVLLAAFTVWTLGGILAGLGAALTLASFRQWREVGATLGPVKLAALAAALAAPELVRASASVIWFIEPLTRATFNLVVATLDFFGVEATARPAQFVIATRSFAVEISWMCSGVEGFALTSLFLLCYFYAFAGDLRFPQAWLLLPLSLGLSWLLNIVRIAALFTIGDRISPTLAVNGFHSHAGWLMFSILAFAIIAVSRNVTWFRRSPGALPSQLPWRDDWLAARIIPFAAFMVAALLLSTFTETPDVWYIVKVAAMAGALALFLPLYKNLTWRLDPLAVAGGVAIAILWLAVSVNTSAGGKPIAATLSAMPATLAAAWVALRLAGTIVLVPMVEELFFRGYILERLDSRGGTLTRLVALAVSTGLFALLHERWLLAAAAGLVFGLIYLRRRQLSDAIAAHATSNALIAAYALATADWSLI